MSPTTDLSLAKNDVREIIGSITVAASAPALASTACFRFLRILGSAHRIPPLSRTISAESSLAKVVPPNWVAQTFSARSISKLASRRLQLPTKTRMLFPRVLNIL
jgi:hypothetical protein